jgi:hypothetical protein
MSQAKLEFLAGKSVPAIIDWMLENMKETDIRGCLDAAGIQTSVGSRSSGAGSSTDPLPPPRRSSGAGSSTDPLPPPRRSSGAGSSTDPLPFSRAAAAGSSRDPLPLLRIPSPRSSRDPLGPDSSEDILPFFQPGSATRLISREPSEEEARGDFYQPPSLMREPSEEMIDPYSEELSRFTPGSRMPLFREYDFGNNTAKYNKFIKLQLDKQKEARQLGIINGINYIPLLIFYLNKEDGIEYLSFIVIEPFNDSFRTRIIKIEASEQNFETEINTLLNQWGLYNPSIDNISDEVDLSFYNFLEEKDSSGYIYRNIQMLYNPENISKIKSYNYFGAPGDEEDEFLEEGDIPFFEAEIPYNFIETEYENEKYFDEANYNPPPSKQSFSWPDGEGPPSKGSENENPPSKGSEPENPPSKGYDFGKDNLNKPKKFGKISDMNQQELREYVINKFGQNYYNEYEPQVYRTKTGFDNVRYVKRSSPLKESGNNIPDYDYSTEHEDENNDIKFFD